MASSAGARSDSTIIDAGRRRANNKRKRTVATHTPTFASNTTTTTSNNNRPSERPSRSNDRLLPINYQRSVSGSSRNSGFTMIDTPPSQPVGLAIKFTKTGRVSKATKGMRCHACDRCPKVISSFNINASCQQVYTRAEHLRRHQKNHSEGSFICDVPNCSKTFFRDDLLQRHRQRHSESEGSEYHHRSSDAADSVHDGYGNPQPVSSSYQPITPHRSDSTDVLLAEHRHSLPEFHNPVYGDHDVKQPYWTQTRAPSSTSPMRDYHHWQEQTAPLSNAPDYPPPRFNGVQWPPVSPQTRPLSPNATASPVPPYYTSNTSAKPSVDRAHSLDYAPQVSTTEEPNNNPRHISTPSSDVSGSGPRSFSVPTSHGHMRKMSGINISLTSPEDRDLMEAIELQTPTMGMANPDFGENLDLSVFDSEQRYLTAYWQSVHALWPFVHRASFDFATSNPLLRASMIALGAQTGDATDLSNARILHERCLKVLKKRNINCSHSYRICDMQAIVLIEMFSLFKSRRPPLQPSSCFEAVFKQLINDGEAWASSNINVSLSHDFPDLANDELVREAKSRILVACYILERQHSMFFGRPKNSCLKVPGEQLPFPLPLSYWNADVTDSNEYTVNQTRYDYTYQVLSGIPQLGSPLQQFEHDIFRSMHLVACLDDVVEGQMLSTWKPVDDIEASALLRTLDQSPRTRLAYHMFQLCKKAPVRDLLAVAGESWVMAEKITKPAEYQAAQLETENWARALHESLGPIHRNALCHALRIIDIHRTCARTGLLFQDWSLYLATLVVWISSYVATSANLRRKIGGANTPPTAYELERTVLAVTEAGSSVPILWKDACSILLWTKSKLDEVNIPHNNGLTNGALDVLSKLINRGHEDTWLS